MKKLIKILIIEFLVITIVLGIYLLIRSDYNQQLKEIISEIDENELQKPYKNEFIEKVDNIKNEYKFRLNYEIKSLVNELRNDVDSNNCCEVLTNQISFDEMQKQVDNLCENSEDYGVGKIFIYTNNNYGSALYKDLGYVDCTIFTYNLSENDIVDENARIKIRGNSTAVAEKKPYNIKFSEKEDLYNFGEAKKWSLLAEYYDSTMLRNRLFLDFAREMNLNYTSNCNYVEVWFDGTYNGCYLLTESIETGKNRIDIDIENGDFLIEYEADRDEEGVTYITTDNGWRFAMSDPEEPNEKTLDIILNLVNHLDNTINSGNYSEVEELIDIDSFAKLYVLNLYAKTVDFGWSSVYFYYEKGKFYAGPVWDFDLSSGNASPRDYEEYWTIDENGSYISYLDDWVYCNKVFDDLCKYEEFNNKVIDVFTKYSDYMKKMYEDNGIIDVLLINYKNLILNNYSTKESNGAGWKINGMPFSNLSVFDSYDDSINYLKKWLKNRYLYLQEEYIN